MSDEIVKALGTMPDGHLAKLHGCNESTIRSARSRRGIPAFTLSDEIIQALGTMSDGHLAKMHGCKESMIRKARSRRGIPAFSQRVEIIQALCTVPGSHLAKQQGWVESTMRPARSVRGIPAFKSMQRPQAARKPEPSVEEYPPELMTSLGTAPDVKIAEKYKIAVRIVRNLRIKAGRPRYRLGIHSLPSELLEMLGTVSDCEIAEQFDVKQSRVEKTRRELGIAPRRDTNNPMNRRRDQRLDDGVTSLLHTLTNTEISRRTGHKYEHIRAARLLHKIPYSGFRFQLDPALVQCLGKRPDLDISVQFGIHSKTVRKAREKLGIPVFNAFKAKVEANLAAITEGLASMSDRRLAEKFGGCALSYTKLRKEMGVAPFAQRGRPTHRNA
ncbi:hypothetical protein [Pseudomonas syringae]|uniref:hypothetical protein n=1 Tax=Pseudomonas syringae TaxID=317 RepID=UPI001F22A55B|nr:hypothetical protein [Pseudomonas syringae]MCF5372013.1 hypothetical protein [Pseudomonas syringae]